MGRTEHGLASMDSDAALAYDTREIRIASMIWVVWCRRFVSQMLFV
jgi:hypothetical protein